MRFLPALTPYRALWRQHNLRWLALTNFFSNITLYSTVIVAYERSRGLDYAEMFGLESVISFAILVANIPTGVWADQFGYRRILLLGNTLCALSLLPFIFGYGFFVFSLGSLLFGAGVGCINGCESALVYESLPTDKAAESDATFALLGAFTNAGFLFGLSFGSFLATYSLSLPVVLNILPLICAVLATLHLTPNPLPDTGRGRAARADYPYEWEMGELAAKYHETTPDGLSPAVRWGRGLGEGAEGQVHSSLLLSSLSLLRKRPALAGLSLLDSAAFVLINAIFWYNQPFFARAGIGLIWFGPITAGVVGLELLVTLTTPMARERLGIAAALALCLATSGLAYVALAVIDVPLLVIALIALVVAGRAWRTPLISTELNRHIATGARATTLSILTFIGTLAAIALNPLIGHAGDLGLGTVGFGLGFALLILAALAPLLIRWANHT